MKPVVKFFSVPAQHSPGGTRDNHEISLLILIDFRYDFDKMKPYMLLLMPINGQA
jgi:hypothetical protein